MYGNIHANLQSNVYLYCKTNMWIIFNMTLIAMCIITDLLSIQEYHSLLSLLCSDFPFEPVQKTAK